MANKLFKRLLLASLLPAAAGFGQIIDFGYHITNSANHLDGKPVSSAFNYVGTPVLGDLIYFNGTSFVSLNKPADGTYSLVFTAGVPSYTAAGGGGSIATDTIWTTLGDTVYGTGLHTAVRLAGAAGVLHSTGAAAPTWGAIVNGDITAGTIDLTTKVTGILPSANGGTANAFFTVAGPATSAKTYTLPNSSQNILTDAAAVTVAQGGTGIASGTSGGVLGYTGTTTLASSALLATNSPVLGGGSGATPKTVAGILTDGTSVLTLGQSGTSAGGLTLANATSGTIAITPATGALGSITSVWPALSGPPIIGQSGSPGTQQAGTNFNISGLGTFGNGINITAGSGANTGGGNWTTGSGGEFKNTLNQAVGQNGVELPTTFGADMIIGASSELLTLSTGSTTTATAGNLVQAASIIRAIEIRVTTAITTAASFTVKVTGGNVFNQIGTGTSTNSTLTIGATYTMVPAAYADQYATSATTITITTNINPGAGAVRITVYYEAFTPPTS